MVPGIPPKTARLESRFCKQRIFKFNPLLIYDAAFQADGGETRRRYESLLQQASHPHLDLASRAVCCVWVKCVDPVRYPLPSVQADTDKQRLDEQLSNAMASVSHLDGEKEALAAQLGSLRCEFEERVATMAHTEQALLSAEARAAGANESLERLERLQKAYSELSSKVDNSAAAQGALETKCKELTTVWQQVPSQTHLKPISNTSLFFKSKYYVATNWG